VIAGTWAVMMKIGYEGYKKNAKIVLDATYNIRNHIKKNVPEVTCATHDASCVVTLVSNNKPGCINPLALRDVMKTHGWLISPTQFPLGCHFSMTLAAAPEWKKFNSDLTKSV
jgi:glutamate/tyrosine decarboxylase-like PLP-dependent enzyme